MYESYQYPEVLFVGKEHTKSWSFEDLQTFFVLIPAIDKALMIRNSSQATVDKLKELLLSKYHSDLPFVNPTISHKGTVLTSIKLSR